MNRLLFSVCVILLHVTAAAAAQTPFPLPSKWRKPVCGHYAVGPVKGHELAADYTDEDAFALNRRLANGGSADAAFELALAYMEGVGTAQDLAAAEQWFAKGALEPSQKAIVGELYVRGECFAKDIVKADLWLQAAGRPGDLFELAGAYRDAGPAYVGKASSMYVDILSASGHPEVRRAQLELGNLVLDGKYSSGDTPAAHAQNLAWANAITEELLGQVEYTVAVAYSAKVEDVPEDPAIWLRFCRRAAAYDNDLAQQFYAAALLQGSVPHGSPLEGAAWIRLSSEKRFQNKGAVAQMDASLTPEQRSAVDSIYLGLLHTKELDGAYYPAGDALREPSPEALREMPDDDPDVQVRRAFALGATGSESDYRQALSLYRIARDRREMDIRVVLGRGYLLQQMPTKQSAWLARHWFEMATRFGSKPAALYLARWYRGEGGGSPDPVQSYAWQWLGTEAGPKPMPEGLSTEQRNEAEQQIEGWRSQHHGW